MPNNPPADRPGENTPRTEPLLPGVVADLHAGLYDEVSSRSLWRQAEDQPAAQQMVLALDRVGADLRDWFESPAPEPPPIVVDRIVAALRTESAKATLPEAAASAPRPADPALNLVTGPVSIEHARRRRANRRWATYAGVGAAAAAVAAVAFVALGTPGGAPKTTQAQPNNALSQVSVPATAAPVAPPEAQYNGVSPSSFPVGNGDITALLNRTPAFGSLDDPDRRAACLTGLGYPGSPVLGAQPLDVDGPAVLMVLAADRPGELVAVAVRPECDAANPHKVAETRIGAAPTPSPGR